VELKFKTDETNFGMK